MDIYLDYLVDRPDDVPIELKGTAKAGWMYQHVYFQRPFYMQSGIPRIIRDEVLRRFCSSPYNQIAMREDIEEELHNQFEEHVFAPPPETMKKSLIDFNYLDILGAAALGRRVALVPEALEYLVPAAGKPREPTDYSPVEQALFFDGQIERALQALEIPLVTPQRIITGVIQRTGRFFNNERLLEEAQKRIEVDGIYYPMRLRRPRVLYPMSIELLKRMGTVEVVQVKEGVEPLRMEVGDVEVAA